MDDLEFEARLRTHLHRRLDDAQVPASLASNVSQALAPATNPVQLGIRAGRIRLGWAAVAAAVVLAFAVIGIQLGLGPTRNGATPTSSPSAVAPTEDRVLFVLPANGTLVDKAESTLADDVMGARLRALGIGNFTSAGGYALMFSVPPDGPSDASIRAVLSATGDVRIVPLPQADYGAGLRTATIGAPLPKDEPALFSWEGIESVANDPSKPGEGLTITLKTAAAQAFGDYTVAHVGERFAIVIDGRVALLPTVKEAITSGEITVTPADDASFAETAAILVGGILPEAWRGASIPVLTVSRDAAVAAALAATNGGTVQNAEQGIGLSTSIHGDAWQVVWNVEVAAPSCPPPQPCPSAATLLVQVDAVTGEVVHLGNLEP